MGVHRGLVESLRAYDDPRLGIRERFLTPEIGGGRTVAVLSEPLGDRATTAWILCHSFGLEQDNLQSFEARFARRLASSGSPVLRFHAQGYGDSELPIEHVTLDSHIQDVVEAAALLGEASGVAAIGLIGAKLGGAVAALVADRLKVTAVALLEPVVRGRPYMQSMIRSGLVAGLSSESRSDAGSVREDPVEAMQRDGFADVHGFPLRQEVFEEINGLDVSRDLGSFRGRSLVIQISRTPTPRRDVEQLVERLRALGGTCQWETLVDPNALRFGLPRFRALGSSTKVDLVADLDEAIMAIAIPWCAGLEADEPDDQVMAP